MKSNEADGGLPDSLDEQSGIDQAESTTGAHTDGAGPTPYRATFDARTESPSQAVVEAVSAVADTPTDELDPLYAAIDGDALDALVSPDHAGRDRTIDQLTFAFEGTSVTVRSAGEVEVRRLDPVSQ